MHSCGGDFKKLLEKRKDLLAHALPRLRPFTDKRGRSTVGMFGNWHHADGSEPGFPQGVTRKSPLSGEVVPPAYVLAFAELHAAYDRITAQLSQLATGAS